jgi:hypothetical protein
MMMYSRFTNASRDYGVTYSSDESYNCNSQRTPTKISCGGYGNTAPHPFYGSPPTSTDNASMYFKDKPVHKQRTLFKRFSDPWTIITVLLALGVVWGCNIRAQRAWLLREFQTQSMQEAVNIWHEIQEDHTELANEFEEIYSAQAKWLEREAAWKHHVGHLHNITQRESRRAVLDK